MELFSQFAAVSAVLGLLGATLWWLRRRGIAGFAAVPRAGRRRVECLERVPLGPQQKLHLVRFGETALLGMQQRSAAVRCAEPMNVVSVRSHEFHLLLEHLPGVRDGIDRVVKQRQDARTLMS